MVLVSGVAGVGKSRLGWEFEKYVDGSERPRCFWHRGRSLSYGDGVAFWAFAEMVRSRLQILEGDDRAVVEAKLRDGSTRWRRDAGGGGLAGSTGGGAAGRRGDRTVPSSGPTSSRPGRRSWSGWAATEPVVLLFEDTQYADNGLLDLIEHLLRSDPVPAGRARADST